MNIRTSTAMIVIGLAVSTAPAALDELFAALVYLPCEHS